MLAAREDEANKDIGQPRVGKAATNGYGLLGFRRDDAPPRERQRQIKGQGRPGTLSTIGERGRGRDVSVQLFYGDGQPAGCDAPSLRKARSAAAKKPLPKPSMPRESPLLAQKFVRTVVVDQSYGSLETRLCHPNPRTARLVVWR